MVAGAQRVSEWGRSTVTGPSGGNVNADITSIRTFAKTMMMDLPMELTSTTTQPLVSMAPKVREAFASAGAPAAGVFQEGVVVADLMTQYLSDFAHFLQDAGLGLRAMGAAAGTIAELYQGTDSASAATIADVNFAFADPGATPPSNLPAGMSTTTLSEQAAKNKTTAGTLPDALVLDQGQATSGYQVASGVSLYFFADGSSKLITNVNGSTETVINSSAGTQVQRTVQSTVTAPGGGTVMTSSQEGAGGKVVTTVTVHADGSETVVNTTTGADGKSTTKTTEIAANQHATTPDAGPIQTAETKYNSQGGDAMVNKWGYGY